MKNILVIDDERTTRVLLERKLSEAGYNVLIAENGSLGVKIAKEKRSDLILLDIVMPGMDGVMVTDFLTTDARTRDTPVIFITSLLNENEVKDGFAEGSKIVNQHFLAKPFHTDQLLKLVCECIGEAGA